MLSVSSSNPVVYVFAKQQRESESDCGLRAELKNTKSRCSSERNVKTMKTFLIFVSGSKCFACCVYVYETCVSHL
jgi:hypothetical protein